MFRLNLKILFTNKLTLSAVVVEMVVRVVVVLVVVLTVVVVVVVMVVEVVAVTVVEVAVVVVVVSLSSSSEFAQHLCLGFFLQLIILQTAWKQNRLDGW